MGTQVIPLNELGGKASGLFTFGVKSAPGEGRKANPGRRQDGCNRGNRTRTGYAYHRPTTRAREKSHRICSSVLVLLSSASALRPRNAGEPADINPSARRLAARHSAAFTSRHTRPSFAL